MTSILDLICDGAISSNAISFIPGSPSGTALSDLWKASGRACAWWRGVASPGETIAMVLDSGFDSLAMLIGAWRAGLTVASLPYPARAMSELAYRNQIMKMCSACQARLLVVERRFLELTGDLEVPCLALDGYLSSTVIPAPNEDCDGNFIQFTSGSTSEPRGVVLESKALASQVEILLDALELDQQENALVWVPLSHDMGLMSVIASLCAGGANWGIRGSLTIASPETFLVDPVFWLKTISDIRGTLTMVPPFALDVVSRMLKRKSYQFDLSSLSHLVIGGEPIRADTLRKFEEAGSQYGLDPHALTPAYGLAEASLVVSILGKMEHWSSTMETSDASTVQEGPSVNEPNTQTTLGEVVSCGKVAPCVNVRISRSENHSVGELGTIEIKSPSLFKGYVGGKDSSTISEDGWFTTSDIGWISEDRQLYVVGRNDDMFFLSGRNLFAGDMERLASSHPYVRKGNCVVVPRPETGYILVCEPSSEDLDQAALKRASKELKVMLAQNYNASPQQVLFIARGSLPKTPSGKIKRNHLSELLSYGALPRILET